MQFLKTLAIVLPLVASSLAQVSIKDVKCAEYIAARTPGVIWHSEGDLQWDFSVAGKYMMKSENKKVRQDSSNNMVTEYLYTVTGGVGLLDNANGANEVFMAKVERTTGKGLGQQFKVEFWGTDNKKPIREVWVWPNERCTMPALEQPSDIKRISVSSRTL